MNAKDVMTTAVVTANPEMPVEQLAMLMLKRRISAIPVVDAAGRLRGIVSESDRMRRAETATERHRSWWLRLVADKEQLVRDYVRSHGRVASDVMTRKVITVTERTALEKIATLLERHRIKRVPVVRAGRVVGVVSRANLLHAFAARKPARAPAAASDRQIRSRVRREIGLAGVDAMHVNIVVTRGVVECWGFVETAAEKRALRVATKAVPGVKSVSDNVSVLPAILAGSMGAQ